MPQRQDDPEFSVVVASFSGGDALAECLKRLIGQSAAGEIIAAANLSDAECERLGREFPQVQFLCAPRDADVFQLRSSGIAAARGKWVALTEDHCIASAGWLAALHQAIGDRSVVAGPVLPGDSQRWTDRGLFLCEYANLLPPLPERLSFVSGVNAAYPRAALQACDDVWQNGFYDNEVSDALRAAGCECRVASEALVHSRLTMPLGAALAHFYRGGRRFGGYRATRSTVALRAARFLATPAVPLVLLWRILRSGLNRGPGDLCSLATAVPAMLLLLLAWALGEAAGYLRGPRADETQHARGARALHEKSA